ncbi:ABC transporter permease [Bradyrhizobium betae]|uniref:ABC transporter permease n=1 Tax=Bradyrhizobium betae TaxID=244734 RepID=A0A4Q1UMT2_9BRAD|nr:ABC transporter permease [Bradyrhizobium betae]RXT36373.1 hypothetical protein B5V03_32395 [Bradyrhizobium betae]
MMSFSPKHHIVRELALESVRNVRSLKGRSLLALIGISIGTAAVIAMLHIGHSARIEAKRQFESLGIDRVIITPLIGSGATTPIPFAFAKELVNQQTGLATVAPIIVSGTTIRAGRATLGATVIAADEEFYSLAMAVMAAGRPTTALDGLSPYAVLGAHVARGLRAEVGKVLAPGDQLTVQTQRVTIIGILAETDPNPVLNVDLNQSIIIPFAAARRLLPDPKISSIAARLAVGADERNMIDAVTQAFKSYDRQGGGVRVQTARQLIAGVDRQMAVYGLLLLAIGAIALVVGGVGVMNVMLMNVMERRREIGIRMAIGARRRQVAGMFVVETLVLSAIGSSLGTVLGTAAAWGFAACAGWAFTPSPTALPLGIGMAVAVALFFGLHPALRAARMDPILALRAS